VWREPLVWAAADTFDVIPGAALPLALYRERSVSREAALAALQDGELTWEIVYTRPEPDKACARRRLRASPLRRFLRARSSRACASRCRGRPPASPDLEFAIYEKPRPDKAQQRSPQLCWRLRKVHRARRFEKAMCSNPSKVFYGS